MGSRNRSYDDLWQLESSNQIRLLLQHVQLRHRSISSCLPNSGILELESETTHQDQFDRSSEFGYRVSTSAPNHIATNILTQCYSAMVASIIKTTKLDSVPSITNTGAGGGIELIRWGYIENVIIIITSSIPCIRPLIISSVRKLSSGKYSRSYELSMPFGGRKSGAAPNETNQSRRTRKFKSDVENNSIDRILDHNQSAHTSTSIGGAPDSPTFSSPGITKQVEISVISDARQPVKENMGDLSLGS